MADPPAARPGGAEDEPVLQTGAGEGHLVDGFAVFKPIARGDLTPGESPKSAGLAHNSRDQPAV